MLTMESHHFFLILSAIALFTAAMAPLGPPILPLMVMPEFVWGSLRVMMFLNTLLIGIGLVLAGGVPAAVFERVFARPRGDDVTMIVWTVSVALLSLALWQLVA